MKKTKDIFWFLVKLLLAGGIIGYLVSKNYSAIAESLLSIRPLWLLAAVILYFIHLSAGAFRWRLLLRSQGIMISMGESFKLLMLGNFFSLVIPGGAVGGDLAKAGFLSARTEKGAKLKGVFTILVDRIIGMTALFTTAGLLGLLSWKLLKNLSGALELAVYVLLMGCAICLVSTLCLLLHRKIEKIRGMSYMLKKADELSKGAVSNVMAALDTFRDKYPTLIACFLISVIFVHLNISILIVFIAYGVGMTNVSIPLFLLVVTLGNAAGAIPLTPSGIGTREMVMTTLLSAIGAGKQSAAIPLIYMSIMLVYNLSGGIFFVLSKTGRPLDNSSR